MTPLGYPLATLAWLGRQGTRAVAASIFIGLAIPQLAASFKPYLPESIFLLLTIAFLRVDPAALRGLFVRPRLILAALAWTMIVLPALFGGLYLLLGLDRLAPDLLLALVLQAAAPPITSAPAFAALMGLEATLSLALLVAATAVTPVTGPLFAQLFAGRALTVGTLDLGLKLFFLLVGSAVAAALIRRLAGRPWVERQKERIDGLNVILLFVFAVALMDGVAVRIFTDPPLVLAIFVLAFAWSLTIVALTTLIFLAAGRPRAFVIGLAAGHRNIGLMIAALGIGIPDLTWLYFALAQFPIYLLPQLLKPLARRIAPAAG